MSNRRQFLRTAGLLGMGAALTPLTACPDSRQVVATSPNGETEPRVPIEFELPPLGYAFNALEPHIDAMTMEIHHGKHHAAYVSNLNQNLAKYPAYAGLSSELLCAQVAAEDLPIRNNGGGHWNHSQFWRWISPGGPGVPGDRLAEAIQKAFGSMDEWKRQFTEAAKGRFGSGWAWLCVDQSGQLFVVSTPNQDNPLMAKIVEKTGTPVLGIDVWEHAYYLHYQNRRPDYISAFFNVINWAEVEKDYLKAIGR